MTKHLEDETPSSRLRQLGMINLMYSMNKREVALTLTTISEVTGLTRKAVQESIDPLVRRGLLVESWGRTSLGRGKARQYQISPKIFEKLQGLYGG